MYSFKNYTPKKVLSENKAYLSSLPCWEPKGFKTHLLLMFNQAIASINGVGTVYKEGFKTAFAVFKNQYMDAAYDVTDYERVGKYLLTKYKDIEWINKIVKTVLKKREHIVKLVQHYYFHTPTNLPELKQAFLEVTETMIEVQRYAYIVESFTLVNQKNWATRHLESLEPELSEKEKKKILQPQIKTYVQEYFEEIYSLPVEEIKKKWYWIKGSYYKFPELSEKEIEKDKLEKHNLSIHPPNFQSIKKETVLFAKFVEKFVKLHDLRKANVMQTNYTIVKILENISKLIDYKRDELLTMAPLEVLEVIEGKKISKELLRKRNESCVWFFTNNHYEITTKKEDVQFIDDLIKGETEEIKGYCANKGKVQGKVRIILYEDDFSKMKKGDILVTKMTRPEFVQLMKMAKAFVTDEGGLTCHAAILSRELGKPCIIGTRNATKVLKDGEEVIVDADNGIVIKK